jgi:peptidoglycan/xylan/chitin deacetylase (PgdA/CDA1 family)
MTVRRIARRALGTTMLRKAALTAAAWRRHALVLVFHRICEDDSPARGLVPAVPETLFRRQLEALLEAGDVVPLDALHASPRASRRPRFAVTFDDDAMSHHDRALPVLRSLGMPATFFLCGRALHGLPPLWFEKLDRLVVTQGVAAVARDLGVQTDDSETLARACEHGAPLRRRVEDMEVEGIERLGQPHIRALTEAGMTIGFHTLHHPVLPALADPAIDDALSRGRAELEEAAGHPVQLFAYPHGKAGARAAARLPALGYTAAFTGRPVPVRRRDDRFMLGRWEAGAVDVDTFVAGLAARVNGWGRG